MNLHYVMLDLIFLLPAIIVFAMTKVTLRRRMLLVLCLLFALTLVFDNLIIWAGIVSYDSTNISGLKLGLAPVEDFAYSIAAAIIIPTIWERLKTRDTSR